MSHALDKALRVLVVDDERGARMALEVPLRLNGYEVVSASGGHQAIELGKQNKFDVVLTDIFMPDVRGIEVVREFRRLSPETRVIAMTAQGSVEIALEAIQEGAFDFIAKPFDIEEVLALISRAARHDAASVKPAQAEPDFSVSGLIGHSPQMVRAYKLTAYAARTDATVLIEGESGTGKELVARAIHNFSDRAAKPFTALNCGALTETLLEAELFGYTRGSFTGAANDRAGLFESTDGGTVFLDELGNTGSSFQASLLRVIQEREVRRIGSRETRRTNVRVIGATNTDLQDLAERGEFRRDLFYRLSVLVIKLPPLRARGADDIRRLTHHFLQKHDQKDGARQHRITEEALSILAGHQWPGNVRELENTIEHAVAVCSEQLITKDDLPPRITDNVLPDAVAPAPPVSLCEDRPTLDELSRRYIRLVLSETGGNKSRAAEILGVNRRTLYRYLEPGGTAEDAGAAKAE